MIMNHINIALLGAVSKYFAVSYTSFIQSISFPSPEESTMVAVEGDLTDLVLASAAILASAMAVTSSLSRSLFSCFRMSICRL